MLFQFAYTDSLSMAKLKLNRRVPNKNADLLKKISLMGTKHSGDHELDD